jgi:hypothetical protein
MTYLHGSRTRINVEPEDIAGRLPLAVAQSAHVSNFPVLTPNAHFNRWFPFGNRRVTFGWGHDGTRVPDDRES